VWSDLNELGDLERLRLVLDYIPDEEFMQKLEYERGNGRDDYPVRAMWNSILAGVVFEHPSVESLRRELSRNCSIKVYVWLLWCRGKAVPPDWVYSRFFKKLFDNEEEINKIFDKLVEELYKLLPDFGKDLAIDSKL